MLSKLSGDPQNGKQTDQRFKTRENNLGNNLKII